MRYICLDTETTGSEYYEGHRVIELGCVEVIDGQCTGHNLQMYFNPERDSSPGAYRTHKISRQFLMDKPKFADCAEEFLKFIEGTILVIHHAAFDLGFLNNELRLCGKPSLKNYVVDIIDTVVLGRKKFPKVEFPRQRYSLDALYKTLVNKNYNPKIQRNPHGALLDAQMLAEVYIALNMGQVELPI